MDTQFITKHAVKAKDFALDWRNWLRGLIGAVIGGVSSTVAVIVVDPTTFNFDTGFDKLCKIAIIAAILNAAQYLKLNPVPNEKTIDPDSGSTPTV